MKIILAFLLITLSFMSCKKDSPGTPDYFLHFKANGQPAVYDGDMNGSQYGAVWAEK